MTVSLRQCIHVNYGRVVLYILAIDNVTDIIATTERTELNRKPIYDTKIIWSTLKIIVTCATLVGG